MNVRVLLIVFLLALPAAPAGAFFGAVYDGELAGAAPAVQDAQFARMRASGVEHVRTVFSWAAAQPDPAQPPAFALFDPVVARAARNGLDLLPVVLYAPAWARADAALENSPPARPADYAAFLTALDGRYGTAGSLWAENPSLPRRPVRQWQIWNEPHLRQYWNAADWPAGYTALLKSAHAALSGRAKVVMAGLTNQSWEFAKKLRGARGSYDVAAFQTYTSTPAKLITGLGLFRRAIGGRTPIWLTELGFPAARGRASGKGLGTTDRGMASKLTGAYKLLRAERRRLGIQRAYWYTWASSYSGRDDVFRYAGLGSFGAGRFAAKPALTAFRRAAR